MKWKVMHKAIFTAIVLAALSYGCRSPGEWTVNVAAFDASIDDDAGPGELCPEGTPDFFNNAYSPYLGGEETVSLEVVDFSYFRCPHCAHFAELFNEVWSKREDFRKRVRIYFHHYPFSNQSAWELHAATVAAGDQGMENFWAVHDFIYDGMNLENPEYYSLDEIIDFVDNALNLDMDEFNDDRTAEVTYSFLEWDKNQGLAQDVGGTPSVFICGKKIGWSNIEAVVDSYLNP